MQSVNVNNGIHCKVATQDAVRRFFVKNTAYDVLLEQICTIFGFSKDSVAVKYLDDEGDLVTISSDAELQFAIGLSPRLLKLKVEIVQPATVDGACATSPFEEGKRGCKKWRNRGDLSTVDSSECGEGNQRLCNKKWRKYAEKAATEGDFADGEGKHWKKERKCAEKQEKRDCKRRNKLEKRASKCGKWSEKSEEHKQKLLSKPERIQCKLSRLRNKQERLQAKLGETNTSESPAAPGLEKVRAKLACVQSKIAWLEQVARAPNCDSSESESGSTESVSDSKKEELRLKFESLQEQLTTLRLAFRQAQLQHQLLRTNFHAFVSQKPPQPDEAFETSVTQMKANLEASKKEVHEKKEALRQLQEKCAELRAEMRQCGMRKFGKCRRPNAEEDENDETEESEGRAHPWAGPHHGPHGFHHGHHRGHGYGHRRGPHPGFYHHGPHHGPHGFHHGPHGGPQGFPPGFQPGPHPAFPGYPPQGPVGQPREPSTF